MSLFSELKRRNVLRVGAAYVVVAWLLIQVAETIFPLFGYDDTPARLVVIILAIGLVPALIFAWAFELTPEGLKRESELDQFRHATPGSAKRLDRLIMVALALALGYFAFDKFVLSATREATIAEEARRQGRSQALAESYGEKSIAVLPFINMSAEPEQEYFSDGISEELLNVLAQIPELRVISRSSAFSFKGKDIKTPEVAQELNVAHVLEGSVRKAGNRVRITVQLIEARSDTHLWSETYDRTLDDIFAIQDEIATTVVEQLKVTLLGAIPEPRNTHPDVYALYLQGRYLINLRDENSFEKAVATLERAVTIDPEYAPAWVSLATAYSYLTRAGLRSLDEGPELARAAADKALSLDSDMASAWAQRAFLKRSFDWDWDGAQSAIDRALKLEPNNADVLGAAASLATTLAQFTLAIELFERAAELDPLNLATQRALGRRYVKARRFDDAIRVFERLVTLNPDYRTGYLDLGLAYTLSGDPQRGLIEMDKNPPSGVNDYYRVMALHGLGREAEVQALLEELAHSATPQDAFAMACAYARVGENDAAFEWLETSYQHRRPNLVYILSNNCSEGLEGDPRFPVILEKLGLLKYWTAPP